MAENGRWIDLLDPSRAEIEEHAPDSLNPAALEQLAAPATAGTDTRPTLQGHGDYVFGVLLVPIAVPAEDRVFYQEVDLVLDRELVLTVRKTPPGDMPFDPSRIRAVCDARGNLESGMIAYHVVDEVAEHFLELLDAVDDEIDELEEHVDDWPSERVHRRVSDLRHDLLELRRQLSPTRDAVRGVVDGRVDLEGRLLFTREVFPREVEVQFGSVYDKLLRAIDGLEFSRDLLAAVRDYQQTKIANDQNQVVKTLTVIASLVLLPTFIVGVYGQNFEHTPELRWQLGYGFSWGIIITVTLVQLAFFRWKRWI